MLCDENTIFCPHWSEKQALSHLILSGEITFIFWSVTDVSFLIWGGKLLPALFGVAKVLSAIFKWRKLW